MITFVSLSLAEGYISLEHDDIVHLLFNSGDGDIQGDIYEYRSKNRQIRCI